MRLPRRHKAEAQEPTPPRFVCQTCSSPGPFYAAHTVTNWIRLAEPYRTPSGDLVYLELNIMLPGDSGPALEYLCGNCRATSASLEELVIEPLLLEVYDRGIDR